MHKYLLIAIASVVLLSCGKSKYGFRDVSTFTIDTTALANKEPVKVIYTYRGPVKEKEKGYDYYNHVIVVSQTTGDTVNILTTTYVPDEYDKNKVYNYFGPNEMITKMADATPEEMVKITNPKQWDAVKLKERHFVYQDKKFDQLTNNQFPTVIGSIGTMMQSN